jgi:hypothetical protein
MSAHAYPNSYVVTPEGDWSRAAPKGEAWTPTADEAKATRMLAFLAGWGGGFMPVYRDEAVTPIAHIDCSRPSGAAGEMLRRAARARESCQLEVGLPESRRGSGGPGACTVLWVWVETPGSVRRAARFRPLPSVVLKAGGGCRRLLVWGLEENVPYPILMAHNKRLAYHLHAPQKWSDPGKLRVPLPGTFLRVGRKRPAPVVVTRLSEETFLRAAVGGKLRDPPLPYMDRLRRGEIKK